MNMKLCAKVIQCVKDISKLTRVVIKTDVHSRLLVLIYIQTDRNDQIIAVTVVSVVIH